MHVHYSNKLINILRITQPDKTRPKSAGLTSFKGNKYLCDHILYIIVRQTKQPKEIKLEQVNEYDQLLECLEDLVGQMQSEKITLEQAKQGVKSLNQYYSQLGEK